MQLYKIEVIHRSRLHKTSTYYGCLADVQSWIDAKFEDGWSAINILLEGIVVSSKIRSFRVDDVPINKWY